MRLSVLSVICCLSTTSFSQISVAKPWHGEIGVSTNTGFQTSHIYNLRYISSRFRWSDYEGTADEDKHPDRFKNSRIMVELIYGPPLEVLCTGINLQSRFINYKGFTFEIYGGFKIFIKDGAHYKYLNPRVAGTEIWYLNIGALCQIDLGFIAPFVDIGRDGIFTVGTEVNLHPVFKKPKKRYRLKKKPYINE